MQVNKLLLDSRLHTWLNRRVSFFQFPFLSFSYDVGTFRMDGIIDVLLQVVVCSFVHGNLKAKSKGETSTNDDKDSAVRSVERSSTMVMSGAGQEPAPNPSMVWPPSSRADIRTMQTGIDLMRG